MPIRLLQNGNRAEGLILAAGFIGIFQEMASELYCNRKAVLSAV
jgi:hypothetical protein